MSFYRMCQVGAFKLVLSYKQFIRRCVVALVTLKHAERHVRAPYRRTDQEDQSVVAFVCRFAEILCPSHTKGSKGHQIRECICKHRTVLFALGNLLKTQTHLI